MDIQQLYAALQPFQNTAAGTLTIAASDVADWPDVHALLVAALAGQRLVLTGIGSFPPPPTSNAIGYVGVSGLFPWDREQSAQTVLSVTATFSVDPTGEPQLVMRGVVPAGANWRLPDSLAGLADTELAAVEFDTALFALTSTTVTVSGFSRPVEPFVALAASVVTAGPFAPGQPLLTTPDSRQVEGPIVLTTGSMPVTTLDPVGGTPINLPGVAVEFFFGATVYSYYRTLPYHDPLDPIIDSQTLPFVTAGLQASMALGPGPALVLSMPVLPASDFYVLSVAATRPLASWAELDALVPGVDLAAAIPADVPPAAALVLRELSLSLYFPSTATLPTVSSLTFDVFLQTGDWQLLPNDILTLQGVGAGLTVLFEEGMPQVAGLLYSDFTIVEELPMRATLSIPQLVFTAALPPNVTVSVESLMGSVLEKLTGRRYAPPIAMDISRLEMSVDVPNRTFGFGTDILTDWSISFGGGLITLGFQGITFDIDYNGQELQAALTALTSVNEGRFFFSAVSPGNGVGWAFAGGLLTGSTLSITSLLLNFMYPDGNVPGGAYGIPELVIDQLAASLATDAENNPSEYTFEGGLTTSWQFTVFAGSPTLQLSAQVSLHGTRDEDGPIRPQLLPPGAFLLPPAAAPVARVADDAPWQIAGSVSGTFSMYGLLVSAGYEFAPDNSALTFGIWYKQRGIQATLTQQKDPKTQEKQTILTIRLGDLSLGEILDYLIGLAVPGESRRLSTPWDVLYQVNFKNLSLKVNLSTRDIALDYALGLDLGFAQFTSVGLRYTNVNGEGRVYVELVGEFLGQPFGGPNGEPLSWDAVNEAPPTVPGKGATLLDLRYVGFGQHLALPVPVAKLDTVEKVLAALREDMKPVTGSGNPLTDPATVSLRYDGNSNWLFGLDATILDTVTLSAVFFDPTLYGGVIALAGERAGGLAGLRFELLYRKITEDIGELSADLRVPDMFRHLEFGSVSVTLGMIHVNIYTNGNFRIDLGFPHNQDFSRSFAVEVFPFVGAGGFYFAYLTGATSQRVPQIRNGTFSPVIEAGLGLAIGLGKNFQAGPLKAGLTLEVYGIFEGVFAPFNPYDRASGTDNYYWIQGVAGIVGTLYGSVDFVVIKAEVSLVARAQVRFVLEAHRPSLVELKMSVTAKAKIKIIFITVHFSFSFTLEQSFVLGSASATPWLPGGNSERLAGRRYLGTAVYRTLAAADAEQPLLLGAGAFGLFEMPRLRQQRSQLPVRALSRLRFARLELGSLLAEPSYRSRYQAGLLARQRQLPWLAGERAAGGFGAGVEPPTPWPALPVFGPDNAETARLQFLPMFTVADPGSLYNREQPDGRSPGQLADPGSNQREIVLGFLAENAADPDAHGPAELQRTTTEHVHHLSADGKPALAVLVEAFFRWAAQAGAGKLGPDQISLLALEDLVLEVTDPAFQQATFGYPHLVDFLVQSLHFEVVGYPAGPKPSDTSGTFVALPPDLVATVVSGDSTVERDYTSYQPVSAHYADNLAAYFEQLLTDAGRGRAAGPTAAGAGSAEAQPTNGDGALASSMAELIFGEYCALLTQASLQAAIAVLQNYPVRYPKADGPSLATLAADFGSLSAPVRLGRGQRLVDLAGYTGHHPDRLAAANPLAARGHSDRVDLPVEVTPLSIAEDNPAALLADGLSVPMPSLSYQIRSGQSLDAIAAAVPFADSPLTGAAVGSVNQRLVGLLQAGQPLQIPSFRYQPVAGDTQNLLTALMTVRNLGVGGIEHLDWYQQAIATLNPGVLDWSTPVGTVQVPRAYLDSTPVSYPVHPGDTLARIAGTQALYQAMDNRNDPVLAGPVPVPPMSHPIVAVDTFAGLVADFPGLGLDDLIAANLTAAVLNPLAVLWLPPFTARVPAGQTLAEIAAAYDLGLPDLVDIVADLPALYAGGSALTVRDVPSCTVDQLVTDLTTTAQLNTIGSQLSNFVAHGLRAPAPDDTSFTELTPAQVAAGEFVGDLYGVVDLIGQQFSWPDETVPVQITLRHGAGGWLSFADAITATGELAVTAELLAANPRLAAGQQPRAGLILVGDPVEQLTLTVDLERFGAQLPATTVTLNTSPPVPLTDYRDTPVHYNFQVTQHWQAAARPALPNGPADGSPGEPSLWPLPANLQSVAGGPGDYRLATVPLTAPPDTEGSPLASYCWAVSLGITINRVANPNDPADTATPGSGSPIGSPWLDGLYLVNGATAEDSERLYQLWTYLAGGSDTGSLYLLYPPNATSSAPLGYASDAVDAERTVLLKTNLSTVTREPTDVLGARNVPSASTYSAAISAATDFLCLLWQASVVVAGGFYLRYDAGGAGLPDAMFDETGRGELVLLCLLTSQFRAGGPLLAVNNVAVVGDNVDASAVQVYAERTDAGAPTTRVATVPAGTVGFEIDRLDPAPPPDVEPTPDQLAGMLYSLLGYRIEPGAGFSASNEAVPQGPDEGNAPNRLSYQQVISIYRRALPAGLVPQANPWLPPAERDPYAGISASAAAGLTFTMHDVFGNEAIVNDPIPNAGLPDRYSDRLAGLADWPGTTWSYTVAGSRPAVAIEVSGGLQAGNYLPAPAVSSEQALSSAGAHAEKLAAALYQLRRPGIEVHLSTPLAAAPLAASPAPLVGYLSGGYAFTSQLAGLVIRTHRVTAGQLLSAVAEDYAVSAQNLLRDNASRLVSELFASTVLLPGFDLLKHGETLNGFASRVGTTAATLLGQWDNRQAPIPAGTNLIIPPTTAAVVEGWSLAQYAARSNCTPGDIALANPSVPGLIADGLTLQLDGVVVNTAGATFSSLVDDFAELGVTTSVAQIALANQNTAGIFAVGAAGFAVNRRLTDVASTVELVVAELFSTDLAVFCTLNGNLPGLLRQDTRLQIRQDPVPAPPDPLRQFLDQSAGISLADFSAANSASVLATDTVLLLPALLDPATLTASPYGIGPGRTLDQIANLFGVTSQLLGTGNQDQGGVFLPDRTVTVTGFGSVQTGPDDSLASLRLRFPEGSQPSLSQLIDAISDQDELLLPGAVLVCPAPLAGGAPGSDPTTIAALADAFLTAADGLLLAKCNAALAGFLKNQASFTIDKHTFVVSAEQTLANTFDLVNLALAKLGRTVPLSYDAFLTTMLDQPVVDPASRFLLPPPGGTLRAALPAVPPISDVLTELSCTVSVTRPAAEIATSFAGVVEVRQASSTIPPATTGEPATLTGFAAALARAYGGELWLGTSAAREQGEQRQYLIRFAAPGTSGHSIRQVSLGGEPAFLGLPPLSNSLISRPAQVRSYLSGVNPPFSSDSQTLMFQSVDVTDWARDLLATIDLVLSPSYASAGYLATSSGTAGSADFDALVSAKALLATKIAQQLTPVLAGTAALDLPAAQQSLEQLLRVNLSAGYGTDAVVQVPSVVQASFGSAGADAGGHRLTGKVLANTQNLSTSSTLRQLADYFVVSVQAVVELLSATANVLATGTVLQLGTAQWTIGEHDSLSTGIAALTTTPAIFASTFADTAPLFRDGVELTIDGFTAAVGFGDTLSLLADALDVDLVYLAVANQELSGLLTGTVYLRGVPVTITEQTSSLAGLAAAQDLPVAVLAPLIADQAVLTVDAVLHAVRWVPEYSVNIGKVSLDTAQGALTLLLSLKNRAQYRRLFLNLGFGITALEYAIFEAQYVEGYQTSKWLHPVNPLPSRPAELNGAVLSTDLGQLDIPVALRAYPVTPRLVNQSALASYTAAEIAETEPIPERIAKVKAWTYSAGFELQLAAQDIATITVGFNYGPSLSSAAVGGPDPFPALAEYASNAAAIKADLATLMSGAGASGPVPPGRSAMAALADLAAKVAASWGYVPPTPATDSDQGNLVAQQSYTWQLQTRARSGDRGEQLLSALVLVREPGTDSWGPDGTIPSLGYLDSAGELHPLQKPEVPSGPPPQSLTYLFTEDVAVGSRLVYVIWYDDLNVVEYQNARASLTISRNQNLTPGSTTNEPFVYRTPPLTFTNLAVPSLLWDQAVLFGSGSRAALPAALTSMFTEVLGTPPTRAQVSQKLTGNYGYRLAPPDGPLLPTDLVSLIPIFYRPTFPYADTVPADTGAAVDDWFGKHPPSPDNVAFFSFDLQLFSGRTPGQVQPLVRFGRLDYQLD